MNQRNKIEMHENEIKFEKVLVNACKFCCEWSRIGVMQAFSSVEIEIIEKKYQLMVRKKNLFFLKINL